MYTTVVNTVKRAIKVVRWFGGTQVNRVIRSCRFSSVQHHMPSFDTSYPDLELLHSEPPVYQIRDFISEDMCDEIVSAATTFGERVDVSRTYLLHKGENASEADKVSLSQATRSSTTWYLQNNQVEKLLQTVSTLTGHKMSTFEEAQVVRYKNGERYAWHQDAIPKSKVNPHAGNRLATVLIYLNTLPDRTTTDTGNPALLQSTESINLSGYTSFRDFKLDIRPEKGKCIVFFPCYSDGTPDTRTAHCSHAIHSGEEEKWIAQIWVHQRPYLF